MSNTKLKKLAPIKFARDLRSRQTDEEKKLWQKLRDRRFADFKFRRQKIIGNYIVDFVCEDRKLIIELDGSHHTVENDGPRDDYLRSLKYRVLRFSNFSVNRDIDFVMENIWIALHDVKFDPRADPPHPALRATFSLKGEG